MLQPLIDRISPLYRKLILVALDTIAVAVSFYFAVVIQYPGEPFGVVPEFFIKGLIGITLVRMSVFVGVGLYDLIWKYASVFELGRIFKSVVIGSMGMMAIQYLFQTHRIPGRVLIVDMLICFLLVGGIRFSLRLYRDYLLQLTDRSSRKHKEPVLIIGAGDGGEVVARELKKNKNSPYIPVGFIDDQVSKTGKVMHQIPILGTMASLKNIAAERRIKTVIIAIPSASGKEIRRIVDVCNEIDVHFKITPGLNDLLSGNVQISQLRNVAIEDLLGRDVVETDLKGISAYLSGGTILITGSGGSIGSELARQMVEFTPKKLILLDHAETPLYHIDLEIRELAPTLVVHSIVADVKDQDRMTQLFAHFSPDVVFHAAAYKHVPLMEFNPEEAVLNNILGTQVILDAAGQFGTKEFVLISTDKAVRPPNAMGASKRICEILTHRAGQKYAATTFTAVRFGNVLGSQGSVIPLFTKQIANGGPITVTHPEITRYFMTIPEAVRLVIQAGALAKSGDLFILDMGEPVKVLSLAKDLIKLSGLSKSDIKIEFTGLRPGEKLHEELVFDSRELDKTIHKKIFVTRTNIRCGLTIEDDIRQLITECYRRPSSEIRERLLDLANNSFPVYDAITTEQVVI